MREALDASGADCGGCGEHGRLLLRLGRDLRGDEAVAVEQDGIRERAADVDAENRHRRPAMLQADAVSCGFLHNVRMNKYERQGAILRLVQERAIATQGELVEELRARGIDAVQTTVSRDIHQLGLVKTRGDDGRLAYALPGAADIDRLNTLTTALRRWALSIEATDSCSS